jgi:hypothetical protein
MQVPQAPTTQVEKMELVPTDSTGRVLLNSNFGASPFLFGLVGNDSLSA